MYQSFGISEDVIDLFNRCEKDCKEQFEEIDEACNYNSLKVLTAFHKNKVNEACFNSTTGYGYNDLGRETIENVFKEIASNFSGRDAISFGYYGRLNMTVPQK